MCVTSQITPNLRNEPPVAAAKQGTQQDKATAFKYGKGRCGTRCSIVHLVAHNLTKAYIGRARSLRNTTEQQIRLCPRTCESLTCWAVKDASTRKQSNIGPLIYWRRSGAFIVSQVLSTSLTPSLVPCSRQAHGQVKF